MARGGAFFVTSMKCWNQLVAISAVTRLLSTTVSELEPRSQRSISGTNSIHGVRGALRSHHVPGHRTTGTVMRGEQESTYT